MGIVNNYSTLIYEWVLNNGVQILGILVGAFIVRLIIEFFLARLIRRMIPSAHFRTQSDEKMREATLIRIVNGVLSIVVWLVAGLMILSQVGFNIGPLLATAGVAGLAIGFGAQYLIRDIVAGLFIILENQYRVGDVVCLGSTCGLVEDVTVRTATLRDLDGTVHHIPHGTVDHVSNLSKGYARVNLNIRVSYSSNLEKVIEVVNQVGKEMSEDPKWKEFILKVPEFLRVDDFAKSSIVIKILGDTQPLKQWDVTGELRKRLKIAFDKNNIEIPLPQLVIHNA